MRLILLNIFLALLWCLMWGTLDIGVLLSGLLVSTAVLALVTRSFGGPTYGRRLFSAINFVAHFIRIMVLSNLQVAWVVLRPGFDQSPRIIRYNVENLTEIQITTLASTISLTPGTLSMDISEDGKLLYIHCMFGVSRDQITRDLDTLRDRLLKELFE